MQIYHFKSVRRRFATIASHSLETSIKYFCTIIRHYASVSSLADVGYRITLKQQR